MLKRNFYLILFLIFFPSVPMNAQIEFSYEPGGYIWFKNSEIQLRYDSDMYCKVFYRKEGEI